MRPRKNFRARFLLALPLLCLALLLCVRPAETPAEHAADLYAQQEMSAAPRDGNLPDYSLPPAKLAQAQHLETLRAGLHLTSELWSLILWLLLLSFGIVARLRDGALALTPRRWLQGPAFFFLLLLTRFAFSLPLSLYAHHLSRAYGFSIQGWPGWLADVAKSFALNWLIGSLLLLLIFALIRRSPRRWWLWLSAAAVPIALAGVLLAPIVADPLFNRFEPLAAHHPDLVQDLQRMGIPAGRTFLMLASAKVTTPNAYVTGLGPTKRLVVWDTELNQSAHDPDARAELLWTLGHESGHYVLRHIPQGLALTLLSLPPAIFLGYLAFNALLRRFGPRWRIAAPSDWAAAAVLLLLVSLGSALAEPLTNTVSRHFEHDADIYGQEALHTLVANPQTAVTHAAATMGQSLLEDPNPSPWVELWLYNHPATGRRAAFGHAYNPWTPTPQPKFLKGRQ